MKSNTVFESHLKDVIKAKDKQLAKAAEIIRGMMESNAKMEVTEAVYASPAGWYMRTGNQRPRGGHAGRDEHRRGQQPSLCALRGTRHGYLRHGRRAANAVEVPGCIRGMAHHQWCPAQAVLAACRRKPRGGIPRGVGRCAFGLTDIAGFAPRLFCWANRAFYVFDRMKIRQPLFYKGF